MPLVWLRDGNGKRHQTFASSLPELRSTSGIGKRWSVSLDEGATWMLYREVTDAAWSAFFGGDGPAAPPAPLPGASARDDHRADALASLTEELGALRARFDQLPLDEFVLASRFDPLLADVRGDLARLREALSGVPTEDRLVAAVARVEGDLSARLERRLGDLDRVRHTLAELAEEDLDRVAQYRPGTIETLRQQLETERQEVERLRAALTSRSGELDARERELIALKGERGVIDPATVDKLRALVAGLTSELDTRKGVELENAGLRRRVAELEPLEALWREQRLTVEQNATAERELRERAAEVARLDAKVCHLEDELRTRDQIADDLKARLRRRTEQADRSEKALREVSARAEELDRQLAAVTAERDAAAAAKNAAAERTTQAETRCHGELESMRGWVRETEARLLRDHAERVRRIRQDVEAETEAARAELAQQVQRTERARDQWSARANAEATRAAALEKELDEARGPQVEWAREGARRAAETAAAEARLAGIHRQADDARKALDAFERDAETKRQDLRARLEALEVACAEADVRLAGRREELRELEAREARRLEDARVDREARVRPLVSPILDDPPQKERPAQREVEWLAEVQRAMDGAGFHFPPRIVESFHTSLKIAAWAPLTVLAGVSGTGKSELPRLYSLYGGLRFLSVPVQPNWDSPQDLFGFFDYVAGRFRATDLVRAMAQSQRPRDDRGGFADGLLLVLLDEMNLARIELYFSELLSRLETRRGLDEAAVRSQCVVRVDLGADADEYPLPLGDNVLWVGTMNEDETTQTLSDKVLDRGNVLSFPRPRQLRTRASGDLGPQRPWLARATWRSWLREPDAALSEDVRSQIRRSLDRMNEALVSGQRALGHRVFQAIERYVANHPAVSRSDVAEGEPSWQRPFEEQLVLKVMPKLRGVETGGRAGRRCLDAVEEVLKDCAPRVFRGFRQSRDAAEGAFVWIGSDALDEERA